MTCELKATLQAFRKGFSNSPLFEFQYLGELEGVVRVALFIKSNKNPPSVSAPFGWEIEEVVASKPLKIIFKSIKNE
jgi:hypothetical protein